MFQLGVEDSSGWKRTVSCENKEIRLVEKSTGNAVEKEGMEHGISHSYLDKVILVQEIV